MSRTIVFSFGFVSLEKNIYVKTDLLQPCVHQ